MLKVSWSGNFEHGSTIPAGRTWLVGAQGGAGRRSRAPGTVGVRYAVIFRHIGPKSFRITQNLEHHAPQPQPVSPRQRETAVADLAIRPSHPPGAPSRFVGRLWRSSWGTGPKGLGRGRALWLGAAPGRSERRRGWAPRWLGWMARSGDRGFRLPGVAGLWLGRLSSRRVTSAGCRRLGRIFALTGPFCSPNRFGERGRGREGIWGGSTPPESGANPPQTGLGKGRQGPVWVNGRGDA